MTDPLDVHFRLRPPRYFRMNHRHARIHLLLHVFVERYVLRAFHVRVHVRLFTIDLSQQRADVFQAHHDNDTQLFVSSSFTSSSSVRGAVLIITSPLDVSTPARTPPRTLVFTFTRNPFPFRARLCRHALTRFHFPTRRPFGERVFKVRVGSRSSRQRFVLFSSSVVLQNVLPVCF